MPVAPSKEPKSTPEPKESEGLNRFRILTGLHACTDAKGISRVYGKGEPDGDIIVTDQDLSALHGSDKFLNLDSPDSATAAQALALDGEAEAMLAAAKEKLAAAEKLESEANAKLEAASKGK